MLMATPMSFQLCCRNCCACSRTWLPAVVAWTNRYNGKTRVFGTTLGHNNDTVADPRYLDLVTRGLLWSVDKLDAAHLTPAK